jgi:hypothetical protein
LIGKFNFLIQLQLINLNCHFSGFKSASILSSFNPPINTKLVKQKQARRKSSSIRNLTKSEKLLKKILKIQRKKLLRPKESLTNAFNRFNPKITLDQLSVTVRDPNNLADFIPKVQNVEEIQFQAVILHSRTSFDARKESFFVRWIPIHFLDDEWIAADHAKQTELRRTLKLSEMSSRQRKLVCDGILKGIKFN